MKVKTISMLGKILLVAVGFIFCVLKWFGKLPSATVNEIWYAVVFAYGVGFGTIDFNIIRDNWVEKKDRESEVRE